MSDKRPEGLDDRAARAPCSPCSGHPRGLPFLTNSSMRLFPLADADGVNDLLRKAAVGVHRRVDAAENDRPFILSAHGGGDLQGILVLVRDD